ncbi:MAG: YggS family pyridoxal phosphate-dependent enzyme [Paludibacteraceae bacterium]|jgi:pyridoxal phosphate enzyme (YggS family)|nr:YggS family pyridoxal phosphate-dependent enzyme [Paludibacteraceae bacterium]MED9995503.1 YggS family pyridoxal phosphate-dependent enzyme [Paludibacteraceae bacterium]
MSVAAAIQRIKSTLPAHVELVAVSKFNPIEALQEAYEAGQRLFGESQAQELVPKAQAMPADVKWHFIGHLQTNKVKYIAPYVACIESVDSLKLLVEINKQAAKIDRVIPCLLQFHVAQEETKWGLTQDECEDILNSEQFANLRNIRIDGVMGMASNTENEARIRADFAQIARLFAYFKIHYFASSPHFKHISMGMTHDYPIAIKEGATLVRVGSGIFGERMYQNHYK